MKKTNNVHERAAKLIRELDELTASNDGPGTEVALVTSLGCIFSWQKKKLHNLECVLDHRRGVIGFVVAREGHDNTYQVTLRPLVDTKDRVSDLGCLIKSLEWTIMEICECGPDEDDITTDFSKENKFCSECGHRTDAA